MDQYSKLSKLPSRAASTGYLTNWAARLFAREMDAALKPLALTSAHLPVVFALAEHGALSQRELVAIAAVEQPTMAATLARMERDGLVARTPDPADGRRALISLTDALRALIPQVAEIVAWVNARSLHGLGEAERNCLSQGLLQIIENLATNEGSARETKSPDGSRQVDAS